MATTHELFHLDKRSFVLWKIVDIPTSFNWIIIFSNGPFEYDDGGNLQTTEVDVKFAQFSEGQ
jgi:hypothetical protein